MDKLLEYQKESVRDTINSINVYNRALIASDTGTGKTYKAIAVCKMLGLKPFIVCPLSVVKGWLDVIKIFDIDYYGITNYESLHNCKYISNKSNDKTKCPYIKRVKNPKYKKDNKYSADDDDDNDEYIYEWGKIPDDIIFIYDEAHKCKNKTTVNSKILCSLSKNKLIKIIMLSATIAENPEKFVVAGYVLGLYPDIKDGKRWIGEINASYPGNMQGVHHHIFNEYATRIKKNNLDSFQKNIVIADCFDMEESAEIQLQYKLIEKAVEDYQNKEISSGCKLAEILYARMRIEQLKIPTILKMARENIDKGNSVAIFVNFTETLLTIAKELNTDCLVYGEQTIDERNKNVSAYNLDRSHIIICNIRSGGVGISLHDTIGERKRVSIISPSWSAQDLLQALGRIHRANGKTPVLQYILYCKDTVEEMICGNMKEKIINISNLNDGNGCTYHIQGLIDVEDMPQEIVESPLDKMINHSIALNIRKQRLENDIREINKKLHDLQIEINNFM